MDLYVLNKSLETTGVIDSYESLIWTPRYYTYGDFELYLPATDYNIKLLETDNYIIRNDSETVMIIEKINITTDAENGNYLTVSGRSLESILNRRIIWTQTTFSGTAENLIYKLLNENIINPKDSKRKVANLILGESKGFTEKIDKQITGDNLGETVSAICTTYGYGFRITLNRNKKFLFSLYKGENRSYSQNVNPYVVFSPEFDNLINSKYEKDRSDLATVALVAGEGEGLSRKTAETGGGTGLERYEIYVDARDISTDAENPVTDAEYKSILQAKGQENIKEHGISQAFEGEVLTLKTYQYKKDWNLGDIVQVKNEFGISSTPQITEVIESDSKDGYSVIPTFSTWEV